MPLTCRQSSLVILNKMIVDLPVPINGKLAKVLQRKNSNLMVTHSHHTDSAKVPDLYIL